ncbi:GspE/PulE family protein [Opitutus terrae]|uniref:Type II secretion system protein E n=1 Tax=Opitutus terrae (strain DSM 11246 / JCM 15787 / PB90-1) TaxID=452637 RepID=B1ZZ61_OPITP|nr:GspE/PulE family protein [Opitutus terrae]ACB77133.1 type II secretion system protein E [Opitutus terrae PB90-1]
MSNPRSSTFLTAIRNRPNFDYTQELAALVERHGVGVELVEALIDEKILPKEDVCKSWADSLGVAYVDPFASVITDEAVERIPVEIARKTRAIGLYVVQGVLTVALATPLETELVKRLGQIAQMPISPVFALPREIEDAISIHYCTEKNLEESLNELESSSLFDKPDLVGDKLAALAENNSLTQILDEIIYFALRERATDIHIEAQETQSRIRFRIDGNLREILTYSRKLHRAVVSRLKILCGLNISESRFPQDGRFSMPIGSQSANFRVSTIPSAYGEKAVVRILALTGKKSMLTLDKMMISQTVLQPFKRLIQNPNGIIFVTGPTGSGKTTTLYAALHEINSPDLNISTIEDPIEIQLPGVTQTQVNAHIDLKFATILRALMRQDPDAILIGEIRDLETAKIATEAALTGHIVFATLHTNTAAQAIVRLIEIGVEPYMVAPTVIGVLAQRLAARICDNCKEAYYPTRDVLRRYFADEGLTDVPFYRGRGCTACRGTGYKGRVAFHELVLITEEIRTLIAEGKSAQEITRAAAKVGYKPLRYDGLKKVLLGLTTIEEIDRNTSFEWSA